MDIPGKVIGMSCGRNHSIALTDNGQVFVFGLNEFGQLGLHPNSCRRTNNEKSSLSKPTPLTNISRGIRIAKVVCGPNHSLILATNGWLFGFGDNACGQVGNTPFKQKFNPNRMDSGVKFKDIFVNNQNEITIAISEQNKCYLWGVDGTNKLTETFESHPSEWSISV